MSDIVIKAENLGKKYLIGHQSENARYMALRDVLVQNARRMWHTTREIVRGRPIIQGETLEEVWALKDVSFEIHQGEVLGIIGRNGAGKSTLLKILSRITEPTEGRVRIKGRVASLLEVGTGFHPELTGRENIFLNGAVLGMTRAEIKSKFDEIVAFAEVEKFLDTPVKRYSSGMYVRLAFAVAAHLEPEILVVDEVLAVGDVAFQNKCLGKMENISRTGRTILFVSHNMSSVERLCSRGLVLEAGRDAFEGTAAESVRYYLQRLLEASSSLPNPDARAGNGLARIRSIACPRFFKHGDCLEITLDVELRQTIEEPDFRIGLYPLGGNCLGVFGSSWLKNKLGSLAKDAKVILRTEPLPLNMGTYTINVSISAGFISPVMIDRIENAASFQVVSGDPFGTGRLPPSGHFAFKHSWSVKVVDLKRRDVDAPSGGPSNHQPT